ncbi:MAG: gamma-glutamyl-gamma-aminobutyrate hydrolase family protein [Planctomycetes bacterium]|nr:gamma-glutamyl-gamma-aminobutyrate hydrolase family protein [Planctomycetota bacterium]
MARPLIGINCEVRDDAGRALRLEALLTYVDAVTAAGGAPVMVPPTEDPGALQRVLEALDGLVLIGGRDYDPASWGEAPGNQTNLLHPRRDAFDRRLASCMDAWPHRPVLGICGGCQLLAIARGGTLVQHLQEEVPGALAHRRETPEPDSLDLPRHPVYVEADSLLSRVLGRTHVTVNSSHHQSVRGPGRGLRVVARSPDGVVEGLEDPTRPFYLGVQWHPERMREDPVQGRLFRSLVEAAGPCADPRR